MVSYQNCGEIDTSQLSSLDDQQDSTPEGDGVSEPPAGPAEPAPSSSEKQAILNYCPFDLSGGAPSELDGKAIIRVCPSGDTREGCDTNSISTAVSSATNGSRIEIVNGSYSNCATIAAEKENIEIVGVCGRPILQNSVCGRKGYFVNYGKNISFVNLEIKGVAISASDGANGAALRDQGKGGTKVLYSYFHDNQNGLLGGVGEISIIGSKFENNGASEKPGLEHNIYLGGEVSLAYIKDSMFVRARYQGHNFKSRAKKVIFECSLAASLDGVNSRDVDLSEGNEAYFINSVIQQGKNTSNSNMFGFAFETDAAKAMSNSQLISLENTILIDDKGGSFINYNSYNNLKIILKNVDFVGSSSSYLNLNNGDMPLVTQENINYYNSRSEAGLSAYSTSILDLPKSSNCPDLEYY